MIQSGKFDSSNMDIKKLANSVLIFIIKRLIEIFSIIISIFGILLLISLISYSPEDPNFIFPENTKINNLLGFQGSYTSDLFFQSIGLITFLIPISFILTGINIFKNKEIFLIIENIFYVTIYTLIGSIFFDFFYENTFTLYVNGNGGFVGGYLNQGILKELTSANEYISYYILIFLIFGFFLKSINFNIKTFLQNIKKLFNFLFSKNEKNYTNKNEIINEYIPQEEIKNLIQEDLPFIKAENNSLQNKTKFKIP